MENNKIRLFVDAHSFDKELQGTQTFIRELYTVLLQQYPDLDIYFGAYNTAGISAAFPLADPLKILKYKNAGASRFIFDIPALIKKHRFNFAHFQYLAPKQISNCKYIVTLHDILYNNFSNDLPFFYTKTRNILFGRSIKNAAIKTTVSQYSSEAISKYYNIPVDQITVVPNAVNASFSNHLSKEMAVKKIINKFGIENFLLLVSRVEPRKNHMLVLDTFLKLELYKKKIALVFIGSNSINVPVLESTIGGLNNEQKRYFYRFEQVTQDDLAAFYTACRLFVYPSKGEGFGIPPLEAAICKAPVLCSSATAMKDFSFFRPYTFDPYNTAAFEEKLLQELALPPSEDFIQQVADVIAKNYSWKKSAGIFYNLLQSNT